MIIAQESLTVMLGMLESQMLGLFFLEGESIFAVSYFGFLINPILIQFLPH